MVISPIRNENPLKYIKGIMQTVIAYIDGEYSHDHIHPAQLLDLQDVFYDYQYNTQEYLWDRSPQDRERVLQCIKDAHMEIFGPRIDKKTLCMFVHDTLEQIARHEHLVNDTLSKNIIRFLENLAVRIEALKPLTEAEHVA
jgi:hypothetical protein